jgi:septum formation protein
MAIVLASGSPRRLQLLTWAGYTLDVQPPNVDETRSPEMPPVAHALVLCRRKAATGPHDTIVVAADTIVHLDDVLLEKPASRKEAASHLRRLSGRWHEVTTAVCVRLDDQADAFAVTTRVRFRTLDSAEISRYVATGEPMDKAGAYGIQGLGGALVAEVNGSWTNVMGLPLEETLQALARLDA